MSTDVIPATGTGTLMITLEDVNDNAPDIVEKNARFCNEDTIPVQLAVTDKDSEANAAPFSVRLVGESGSDWTARMNSTGEVSFICVSICFPYIFYNTTFHSLLTWRERERSRDQWGYTFNTCTRFYFICW